MNIFKLRSTILSIPLLIVVAPFADAQSPDIQQQKQTPAVIRKSTGVLQKSTRYRVDPVYPQEAKAQGVSGEVVLEVLLDVAGKVISTKPISGHQLLVDAAMKALKDWRFFPTQLSGVAVEVIGNVVFTFTKDGKVLDGSSEHEVKVATLQPSTPAKTADTAVSNISEKEAAELYQKLQNTYEIPIRIYNPDGIIIEITKAIIKTVKRDEQNYATGDKTSSYLTDYAMQVAIGLHNRTEKNISGVNLKFIQTKSQHTFYVRANIIEMKPQDTQQVQINLMTIAGDPTDLQVEVVGVQYSSGKVVGTFPNFQYIQHKSPALVNPPVDTKPQPLNRITPRLTYRADLNRVSGIVRLVADIGMDGSVKTIRIINALPDGVTDEAIRLVKVLQFKPAMMGGKPVDYSIVMEIQYIHL